MELSNVSSEEQYRIRLLWPEQEETVKNIKNQVQLDVQEAVDFAESSEFPKESELLENVYG